MGTGPVTVPPWENAPDFLPRGVAQDFIGRIQQKSIAMALGRTMRMSAATESIPVVAFRPSAAFVTPAYGGRKPITEIKWTSKEIKVEEVAAVLPVPNAWIMDANFDVEGQVESEMADAMAWAIDAAIMDGTGAPASFPPGGVVAFATPQTGTDPLTTIDDGMTLLEGQGVLPDGIAAGPAIGSALRAAYREAKALPGVEPAMTIYGVPVSRSLIWNFDPEAIIGGWQYLAIGIREDVTFGRSTDGVLFDDAGALVASAFQDNVTLVKVYARIGVAIGQPMMPGPGSQPLVNPFVTCEWVAPAGGEALSAGSGGAERSATTRKRGSSEDA
jgi:hypothetical protein